MLILLSFSGFCITHIILEPAMQSHQHDAGRTPPLACGSRRSRALRHNHLTFIADERRGSSTDVTHPYLRI